jgi:flavin reductase (DIM6/NTAB) family NADH-FMN oxidoreductase RutF
MSLRSANGILEEMSSASLSHSLDPGKLDPTDIYKLLNGVVVPRPIAFVSSRDAAGVLNVAPFSYYNAVCANPPVISFSAAYRAPKDGLASSKDTLANIRATGEFVVNVVTEEIAQAMNQAAAQVPPDVDEFALAGLTPLASEVVTVPRVAEAKVQLECRLHQIVTISEQPLGASLVLGEVVRFHISSTVLRERFHIDQGELHAVGRMAGSEYIRTSDRFELERPA